MEWLDFPFPKDNNGSFDDEYKGIKFLPEKLQRKLIFNWKKYWPQSNNSNVQNWDAVLYCSPIIPNSSLKDKWILIEAKGHLEEGIENGTGAKIKDSLKKIGEAFEATQKRFNIKVKNDWLKKYYQMANRLAFINFLLDNGIECAILYIYFINAWPNKKENVLTIDSWRNIIREEYKYLGINIEVKKYLSEIFVKC